MPEMTAKELAEKIYQGIIDLGSPPDAGQMYKIIESLLSTALEEAWHSGCDAGHQKDIDLINKAKAAAYEEGRKEGFRNAELADKAALEETIRVVKYRAADAVKIVLAEYWNARGEESKAEEWLANKIRAKALEVSK